MQAEPPYFAPIRWQRSMPSASRKRPMSAASSFAREAVVRRRRRRAEARQVGPHHAILAGEMRHPLRPRARGFRIAVHHHDGLGRRPGRAEPVVLVGHGQAGPQLDRGHGVSSARIVAPGPPSTIPPGACIPRSQPRANVIAGRAQRRDVRFRQGPVAEVAGRHQPITRGNQVARPGKQKTSTSATSCNPTNGMIPR